MKACRHVPTKVNESEFTDEITDSWEGVVQRIQTFYQCSGSSRRLRASFKRCSRELCCAILFVAGATDGFKIVVLYQLLLPKTHIILAGAMVSDYWAQNCCPLPIIASKNVYYFGLSDGKQLLDSKFLSSTNNNLQRHIDFGWSDGAFLARSLAVLRKWLLADGA